MNQLSLYKHHSPIGLIGKVVPAIIAELGEKAAWGYACRLFGDAAIAANGLY